MRAAVALVAVSIGCANPSGQKVVPPPVIQPFVCGTDSRQPVLSALEAFRTVIEDGSQQTASFRLDPAGGECTEDRLTCHAEGGVVRCAGEILPRILQVLATMSAQVASGSAAEPDLAQGAVAKRMARFGVYNPSLPRCVASEAHQDADEDIAEAGEAILAQAFEDVELIGRAAGGRRRSDGIDKYERAALYLLAFILGHELTHAKGSCIVELDDSEVLTSLLPQVESQVYGRLPCISGVSDWELVADACALKLVAKVDRVLEEPSDSANANARRDAAAIAVRLFSRVLPRMLDQPAGVTRRAEATEVRGFRLRSALGACRVNCWSQSQRAKQDSDFDPESKRPWDLDGDVYIGGAKRPRAIRPNICEQCMQFVVSVPDLVGASPRSEPQVDRVAAMREVRGLIAEALIEILPVGACSRIHNPDQPYHSYGACSDSSDSSQLRNALNLCRRCSTSESELPECRPCWDLVDALRFSLPEVSNGACSPSVVLSVRTPNIAPAQAGQVYAPLRVLLLDRNLARLTNGGTSLLDQGSRAFLGQVVCNDMAHPGAHACSSDRLKWVHQCESAEGHAERYANLFRGWAEEYAPQ